MIKQIYRNQMDMAEYLDALDDPMLGKLTRALGPVADSDDFGKVVERMGAIFFEQGFKVAVRMMAQCMPPDYCADCECNPDR